MKMGALKEEIHLLTALLVIILALGCIGLSPAEGTTTTLVTIQPMPYPTSTVSTVSTLSPPATTLPVAEADQRAICLEARANRTVYERCKMAATGDLSLPQSELRICAEIQQHAGAYSEAIFHGLKYCAGIPSDGMASDPAEGAYFCKDLGQPDRDECYLSVRMCDPIEDFDIKNQCKNGLELKIL
jgi:hypothetical protein